jgi:hypothetical protein
MAYTLGIAKTTIIPMNPEPTASKRWKRRLIISVIALFLCVGTYVVAFIASLTVVPMMLLAAQSGATTPQELAQAISTVMRPWFIGSILGTVVFIVSSFYSGYNFMQTKRRSA